MPTSQGTQTGTQTGAAGAAGDETGGTALRRLFYLGGGLAAAGAALGVVGVVASAPLMWAFGLGAVAVSLSVLAVTSYHDRSQSV
jgi:hypothetical protein